MGLGFYICVHVFAFWPSESGFVKHAFLDQVVVVRSSFHYNFLFGVQECPSVCGMLVPEKNGSSGLCLPRCSLWFSIRFGERGAWV